MNNYLVILRGNINKLRELEFKTIFKTYNIDLKNFKDIEKNLYFFNSVTLSKLKKENKTEINNLKKILKRAAYLNSLYEIEKEIDIKEEDIYSSKEELLKFIKENLLDLERFRGSFSVHFKNLLNKKLDITERELAEIIWNFSQDEKVNLKNPDIDFFFILTTNKIFFTKRLFYHNKEYLKRMPTKRPKNNPYTLKSDLAKAAVNFLEIKEEKIKKNKLVLDPFCGFGAILLEGEDMNIEIIGVDIKWNDLKSAQENFYYFFNKKPKLILSDSNFQIFKKNTLYGIVTDIPYGKSTKVVGKELYTNFLKNSYNMLKEKKKLVVICSNYFDIKDLIKKTNFKIEERIELYINKSMTRYIYICKKE